MRSSHPAAGMAAGATPSSTSSAAWLSWLSSVYMRCDHLAAGATPSAPLSSSSAGPGSDSGGRAAAAANGGLDSSSLAQHKGRFVSLITTSLIRFVGMLADVGSDTICLHSVSSLGTEGRRKDGPEIFARAEVDDYQLFRISEIKDLQTNLSPSLPMATPTCSHSDPHYSPSGLYLQSGHSAGGIALKDGCSQYGLERTEFQSQFPPYQLGSPRGSPQDLHINFSISLPLAPTCSDSSIQVSRGQETNAREAVSELHPRGWCCLRNEEEDQGEPMNLETSEPANIYQIGSFIFSDRPYATLFYGQGYIDHVIIPSVPNTLNGNNRGSAINFFSKPQYAAVYSPSIRARHASVGLQFYQFLRGFKAANSINPFYIGHVISMIYHGYHVMNVRFNHIQEYDAQFAAELCFFFESVRRDLNIAARNFIHEFNSEFEAFCLKKFGDLNNVVVCIEGLPAPERFISLEAFAKLPGMEFSKPRGICSGRSSMMVADTTYVGRWTGFSILEHIFENHSAGRTWDGKFDPTCIFLSNGRVQIRAPYHKKFTEDAVLHDLLRYVVDVIPMFSLKEIGLPAFFTHLGKFLRKFNASHFCSPDQLRRFQKCGLLSLAFRGSLKRSALFRGLYKIMLTRHVKGLLRSILKSHIFSSDWQTITQLQQHPILRRVYNHKHRGGDSRNPPDEGETEGKQKLTNKFPNTADGALVFVRHADEHGSDGPQPEDQDQDQDQEADDEGCIQLLSDIELLTAHFLEDYTPKILEVLVFSEELDEERYRPLYIMLEEVLEEYCTPEEPVAIV